MDIRIIDSLVPESEVGTAIQALVRTQLANEQSLDATLRQIGFYGGKTLLIGGFVDGRLATMNAFMPQTFVKGGDSVVGYQSGFSATGGEHRGKGYWPKLMAAGLDLIRAEGGAFVFGFPNPVSHPLFEKKLDFTTASMWRVVGPAMGTHVIRLESRRAERFYRPDLRQLATSKRESDPGLVQVEANGGFAFGKVRTSKGLRVADVGGLECAGGDLSSIVRALCKAARAPFFRLEASDSSEFETGLRPKRASRPVILKSLGAPLAITDISFVGGLADSY